MSANFSLRTRNTKTSVGLWLQRPKIILLTAQTGPEIRLITHHSFRLWRLTLKLKDLVITVPLFTTVSKEGLNILAALRYASFYVIAMCVLRPALGQYCIQ